MADVQKDRSARPQRAKGRGGTYQALLEPRLDHMRADRYLAFDFRYVEALSNARTTLAYFFNVLLLDSIPFCRKTGIPHRVDRGKAMQGTGMVGQSPWAGTQ
ncbi:MAG: hypothetical protein A4E19_00015 [Nitrospira sp. SG-bin1]|nr:MAG: hypothetical protein A4E19_00015 [Nitrospira sp. SG-bin1]